MSAGIGNATVRTSFDAKGEVRYLVRVKEGPDAGASWTLEDEEGQRILCGTGPLCTLRLTDPTVSRRHLAFSQDARGLHVYDFGSTNGTVVNGVLVREATLGGGEEVRLGTTLLEVVPSEVDAVPAPSIEPRRLGRMLSVHPVVHRMFSLGEKLAHGTIPFVVEGETGVGKKLFVEGVHEVGPNANEPILVLEATVLPPDEVEAELFGVTREAAKDGVERAGLVAEAGAGTLIVDGPCDLTQQVQRKLLRLLERGEYQRVGSQKTESSRVRVVATSREDLDRAVELGRLREDLFTRLAVTRVEIPPLRARPVDIELLAEHFWVTLSGRAEPVPGDLVTRLQAHEWPSNVRELETAVQRHLTVGEAFARTEPRTSLPTEAGLEAYLEGNLPLVRAREHLVRDFERAYVARMLERHGGNVRRAAQAAGVAHRYFQVLKSKVT